MRAGIVGSRRSVRGGAAPVVSSARRSKKERERVGAMKLKHHESKLLRKVDASILAKLTVIP